MTSAAPPNVTLELHEPVTLRGPHGRPRTVSTLHLALREPEAILKAVDGAADGLR